MTFTSCTLRGLYCASHVETLVSHGSQAEKSGHEEFERIFEQGNDENFEFRGGWLRGRAEDLS